MRQPDSTPTPTDPRPTRQYTCLHCGGMGFVFVDKWEEYPTRCPSCEGAGHFTRPVLPRGAMRAFRVSWWNTSGTRELVEIVHATSPAKAKMTVARAYCEDPESGDIMRDFLPALRVRRAPEQDIDLDGATSERSV